MNDKQKLIAILNEFGIGFQDDGLIITCADGMSKVKGYFMFFTDFEFDADGKFKHMGAWE